MPHPEVNSANLLEYNSTYKLLICRTCRYAIQKSAVGSHLLRHKIYRRERQKLLETIARLDILEPHLVPLPKPGSPAVHSLAVSDGLQCDILDCGHLTVSAKRMQKHWKDFHEQGNTVPSLSSFSHAVKLQTFFRGTQNRYFEVTVPQEPESYRAKEPFEISENSSKDDETADIHCTDDLRLDDLDMHTLRYLHHFSTVAYLTLPESGRPPSQTHWKESVLPLALEQQWLMFGLLALTAFHKAFEVKDTVVASDHLERARILSYKFEQMSRRSESLDSMNGIEMQTAFRQTKALLYLAERAVLRQGATDAPVIEDSITMTSQMIEGCVSDVNVTMIRNGTLSGSVSPVVLDRLHALPSRLADIVGKPDDPEDVFAVLSAISILVDCYQTCSAIPDTKSAWQGISIWVTKRSKRFMELVSRRDPAALVVTAFWYAILVRPTESFWYMHGMSATAVSKIHQQLLRLRRHDILPLIDGLLMM